MREGKGVGGKVECKNKTFTFLEQQLWWWLAASLLKRGRVHGILITYAQKLHYYYLG